MPIQTSLTILELFKQLHTYVIKVAGLLATVKENRFRVSPLRHVEPILLEEEGHYSEKPCPHIVCECYSEKPHPCKQYYSLSIKRKKDIRYMFGRQISFFLSKFSSLHIYTYPQLYTHDYTIQFNTKKREIDVFNTLISKLSNIIHANKAT